MSLNRILTNTLTQNEPINVTVNNCDVKSELVVNGSILPNPANILLLDEVSTQTGGYLPVFKGSGNEIEQSAIKTDNNDLDINNNNVKNSTSYILSNGSEFAIGDGVESVVKVNNTNNIIYKDTETKTGKNLNVIDNVILTKNLKTSLTPSTFLNNELNIDTFRTRIKTNQTDGLYIISSDGMGADYTSVYISNNSGNPRITLNNGNNYNVSIPHINNGNTEGIAFKNTEQAVIICSNGVEKIKATPTTSTYTASQHTFFGQINAANGFSGSVGDLQASTLTLTNNAYIRWGFRSALSATTGYDLTNILQVTIGAENTWYKIPLNSNVIGAPNVLTNDIISNGGANFTTGDITINATGMYFLSINISLRKSSAVGSRFIVLGLGFNGATPSAISGRMSVSSSVNLDDFNTYSASNILPLTAFNSYSIYVMLQDLGGTSTQNILIGDLSSSIIKIG